MLIKIIHKDQEKYKDIIMDSNYTYISCITLIIQDDETGQISEDSERLNFEIQTNGASAALITVSAWSIVACGVLLSSTGIFIGT